MTTETQLLNYLIERSDYQRYLEIGCTNNDNFDQIQCPHKVKVDPENDDFTTNIDAFDLVFIDGVCECAQVHRDLTNALRFVKPGGAIVVHEGSWNQDFLKALASWRNYYIVDTCVGHIDWGCCVILPRPNTLALPSSYLEMSLEDLETHRDEILRLKTFAELKEWI